jgi:hypothetical protein
MKAESSIGQLHAAVISPKKNGKSTFPTRRNLVRKFESFPFILLAILWFLSLQLSAIPYRLGLYPRKAVLKHASPQLIYM